MRFGEVESQKPPAFAVVRPDAFVGWWDERPTTDVCIGLRLIAYDDVKAARGFAAKKANDAHPKVDVDDSINFPLWVEAYQDALMLWVVARGICDPNDITKPWKPFEAAPEDMARDFLTSGGITFLYDRWEKMRIETDPIAREADDAEIAALPTLLAKALPMSGRVRAMRVRRLLAFVTDELQAVDDSTAGKSSLTAAL